MTSSVRSSLEGTGWALTDEMLALADRATGHSFAEPGLRDLALSPPVEGFSSLEFIGDAIVGVALQRAALRRGQRGGTVAALASNDALDERLETLGLGGGHRSGDILEALVGATYLDAGFAAAATVALRLVAPQLLDPEKQSSDAAAASGSDIVLGAAVLSAAFAVLAFEEHPRGSGGDLSTRRSEQLRIDRLVELALNAPPGSVWATSPGTRGERAWSEMKERASQLFLTEGWDALLDAARNLFGRPGGVEAV